MNEVVRRGDVFLADLGVGEGSEMAGSKRPVLILSNNLGNLHSPVVIVAAITGQFQKCKLPTHVLLESSQCGIERTSIVLLEQIRTISKTRLIGKVAELDQKIMSKVDVAMDISLGRREIITRQSRPVYSNRPILV